MSERDPDVFSSLVDKLQYFDPAFHSMTPEGFMGRLNFLHQCTRQGDTRSASDKNGHTANNLAFGRPPFCVLRLGDFYYTKIDDKKGFKLIGNTTNPSKTKVRNCL